MSPMISAVQQCKLFCFLYFTKNVTILNFSLKISKLITILCNIHHYMYIYIYIYIYIYHIIKYVCRKAYIKRGIFIQSRQILFLALCIVHGMGCSNTSLKWMISYLTESTHYVQVDDRYSDWVGVIFGGTAGIHFRPDSLQFICQ